jgi:hypothetical protein
MTIEIFDLTAQIHRWLDHQVARHLETQAARFRPTEGAVMPSAPMALRKLGADESGVPAADLGRMGMSGCYASADEAAGIDEAGEDPRCSAARMAMPDSETVHA